MTAGAKKKPTKKQTKKPAKQDGYQMLKTTDKDGNEHDLMIVDAPMPKPPPWRMLKSWDVSPHTQEKNGMTFLPWAWAWGVLMDSYPDATFKNHHNANGYPAFFDPFGHAMVRVTLTVDGMSHTEDYPVLDYKNQSVVEPNAFQVNTSLKRCLVKCMAYFGLGHYIYAGEDMPSGPAPTFDRHAAIEMIWAHHCFVAENEDGDTPWLDRVLEWAKVEKVEDMDESQLRKVIEKIQKENK